MKKILLIDDDSSMQRLFTNLLRLEKFEVYIASDGDEGVQLAKTQMPHVILLDIMMPKNNGLIILEVLKNDTATQHIPVLMLSNLDDENTIKEAIIHGAEGYMVKSEFTPEIVLAEIERVLNT